MKIVLTGHTGFKGSWFSVMLKEYGHDLYGFSLRPVANGLFKNANLSALYSKESYSDIRNERQLEKFLMKANADLIIHLAAQPLVRYSYRNPEETFTVNVDGTLNVLKFAEVSDSVSKVLVITTDKVYRNLEERRPFVETDSLGGSDPYSTSKAMADLLTDSWGRSVSKKQILIGRAGNVIGGGDFAEDRLIPDLYRSFQVKKEPTLRNPESVRPWQHVLDCLNGYRKLMETSEQKISSKTWNFGPESRDYRTVREVTKEFQENLGAGEWSEVPDNTMHEAGFLTLNSTKAFNELNWHNKLDFKNSVKWTADWYKAIHNGQDFYDITLKQTKEFLSM